MAHKPSGRTHRMKPLEGLNLTPMIDIVTNLMFFLMIFASVLPVVIIDAPLPKVASTADEVKKAKDSDNKLEITILINLKTISVKSDFGGGFSMNAGPDGHFNFDELHNFMVQLHAKKPVAHEVTLLPADDTPYETVIGVMDATRELTSKDPGYQQVPPEIAQKPESTQFNRLFPDVSIGGV
jgi:biopolymer transport protein ExbD